ncbi:four helix bundle protein [Mucilaginibacter sp. SP1R1]|uniref:four helix bundle protein n=1 Tax=Mucilaginibacter sp. SP1R1 TaxID=2723091 RepID=UPI0016095F95|nr:four helix bundle protein [Mucilaginibacter sp. SP1R1]MBB6147755.1 four helix bundle protein [Mucilaginibacter sp. SP1R1]
MDKIELKRRTQKFAVDVIKFIEAQPRKYSFDVLSKQLLRSSTSIGANYRSACKGKSTADFINKIIIVEEEADEPIYWLELMEETGLINSKNILELKKKQMSLLLYLPQLVKQLRKSKGLIK